MCFRQRKGLAHSQVSPNSSLKISGYALIRKTERNLLSWKILFKYIAPVLSDLDLLLSYPFSTMTVFKSPSQENPGNRGGSHLMFLDGKQNT